MLCCILYSLYVCGTLYIMILTVWWGGETHLLHCVAHMEGQKQSGFKLCLGDVEDHPAP